jgi:hypothetical protein
VDHISFSDPLTWVGVLVASFLIAGLRFFMRGGARPPPPVATDSRPTDDERQP